MIEYLPENTQFPLYHKLNKDAIFIEIASDFTLYGKDSYKHNAFFWKQGEEAYISMRNSLMKISGKITDIEELLSFISFTRPEYILISEEEATKLPYKVIEKGDILFLKIKEKREISNENLFIPDLIKLSSFFKKENMYKNEEGFLLDSSYALSKNSAEFIVIKEEDTIVSAVYSGKIFENSAIIEIVATNKDKRRKGYGKTLVNSLINKLIDKNITDFYIFKESDKNNEFYSKLEFIKTLNFVTLKIN